VSSGKARVRIVADVHERASGIPTLLEAAGVEVEIASLAGGAAVPRLP